jgi:hypothetical protein
VQWGKDELQYEKYLIFDALVEYHSKFDGKKSSEVSIKDLVEFIDKFFKDR